MQDAEIADLLRPLRRPLRLTRAGLVGEQIARAGWPLWSVLLVIWALIAFNVQSTVPREVLLGGLALGTIAIIATAFFFVRRFKMPTREDAMVRLDMSMPGRPISAALDNQAIGTGDAASMAVWNAHQERMRLKMVGAKAVQPDLKVSRQDPFGLRYLALLAFAMALGFGSLWRSDGVGSLIPGTEGQALISGPAWEIWIEPPAYTGKPSLYLNDIDVAEFDVPKDSLLTVRLYGEVGLVDLTETVTEGVVAKDAQPKTAFTRTITKSGTISVNDDDVSQWAINVIADNLPTVAVSGPIERSPEGEMQLPFAASDDYGVVRGQAVIELDLASVDRRFGLTIDPEPVETVIVDLPMPIRGNRAEFTDILIENLSKHPWATLPVTISLSVEDGNEQTGSHDEQADLPGRRFFQPIAKAVIEQRRDLIWNRDNAGRVSKILRSMTHAPDDFFPNEQAYLTLRRVITRLDIHADGALTDTVRDDLAEMLWNAAVVLEEGNLADALEKLRRAQEKLSDAMRDGASDEEISELMQELQEAMRDYMQQLAEQQRQEGNEQQQAENQDGQEITQDQIQDMLDEIERLMQEGEMEQAQALLDQLMEMMQNMQVAEGQQGQGQPSPGEQAMEGLQETLRDQQGLSDEAFRDLQEQFNPDAQAGESQENEGRNGGQGRGQSHEGEGGEGEGSEQGQQKGQGQSQGGQQGEGSLADRQQALRDELNRQQGTLPGQGTPEGDAAREALGRAGEAMDRAEDALRNDQTADALGAQSDAMEALREGMRELAEQMAEQEQGQPGGEQNGQASQRGQDPLGREAGSDGNVGTNETMLGGEDARQRSRELLDEIRRRSGEQERPEVERDYLKRLLDNF